MVGNSVVVGALEWRGGGCPMREARVGRPMSSNTVCYTWRNTKGALHFCMNMHIN